MSNNILSTGTLMSTVAFNSNLETGSMEILSLLLRVRFIDKRNRLIIVDPHAPSGLIYLLFCSIVNWTDIDKRVPDRSLFVEFALRLFQTFTSSRTCMISSFTATTITYILILVATANIDSLGHEFGNYTNSHIDNMSIEDLWLSVKRTSNVLKDYTTLLGSRVLCPQQSVTYTPVATTFGVLSNISWFMSVSKTTGSTNVFE